MSQFIRTLLVMTITLMVLVGSSGKAQAQAASQATWDTAITVLNMDTVPAEITITYYADGQPPIVQPAASTLAPKAATSYSIRRVDQTLHGSAVLSSNQRLAATVVKYVSGNLGGRNVRAMASYLNENDGSSFYLVPSVLNNHSGTVTRFSIRNVDSSQVKVRINYYRIDVTTPEKTNLYTIDPNKTQYIDASTEGVSYGFNGSATINAFYNNGSIPPEPAKVVASIDEFNTLNTKASSVEGSKSSANTIYMPTALCNLNGPRTATSYYAIQNADTVNASVVVKFYSVTNSGGTPDKTLPAFTLSPGGKRSIGACTDASLPDYFNGSASIESTGGKIVAVGKVADSGLSTAFLGGSTSMGGQVLALPYVRWSPDAQYWGGTRQRTFISVQNVSNSDANVEVSYRDGQGIEMASKVYVVQGNGGKFNSNPFEAGATRNGYFGEVNGVFGGGAIITAPEGVNIIAVARVASGRNPIATGEDYSGIPIQ